MITAGSYSDGGSDQDKNENGVPYSHAYTVLSTFTLEDGTRLVRIRNPWNLESFDGDWSDRSETWTEALRAEAGDMFGNDGEYFMAIEDFSTNYSSITIAYDIQGWHRSYEGVFADDEPHDPTQLCLYDSTKYNQYKFNLSSSEDQDVYISVYTYGSLQYVATCWGLFEESEVFVSSNLHDDLYQANPDAGHLPMISMQADETVEV